MRREEVVGLDEELGKARLLRRLRADHNLKQIRSRHNR